LIENEEVKSSKTRKLEEQDFVPVRDPTAIIIDVDEEDRKAQLRA